MNPLVSQNLGKVFSTGVRGTRVTALRDLSFSVVAGEVFGLLGPNGAGKTTAIKIFMGLLYPSWGQALVLGRPSWDVSVKARIGFLPEGPYFYEYLTGKEFLDFYGQLFHLDRKTRQARAEKLLSLVGLEEFKNLKLRRYSKGMLQRIGLAQALINDPELVVLDEPMSGLDPVGRKELSDIILRLKREGKTIFFSSHILADVQRICDRIAIIHKGRVAYLGSVSDFLGDKASWYEVALEEVPKELLAEISSYALEVHPLNQEVTLRLASRQEVDRLLARLAQEPARVKAVVPVYPTLEELFVEVIERAEGNSTSLKPGRSGRD